MKKIFLILLSFALVFSLTACNLAFLHKVVDGVMENKPEDDAMEELAEAAIELLKLEWKDIYSSDFLESDCYFEIKNTRVIEINETNDKILKNVDYIVEFVLYTDYFGSAPYYCSTGLSDSVVVYDDGTMEVSRSNVLQIYRTAYYANLSDVVKTVYDLGDMYNCVEYLEIGD